MRLQFSLLALALLPACYSLSLMQDPKPVPPGTLRVNTGLGFNFKHPGPTPGFGLRLGLIPQLEARAKITVPGERNLQTLQLGLDFELPLSQEQSLFFMPYYRYDQGLWDDQDDLFDEDVFPTYTVHAFALPVLFVQQLGPHSFFIGPEVQAGTRDGAGFLAIGGHLGIAVPGNKHMHFIPELSLLTVVDGPEPLLNRAYSGPERLLTKGDVIAEIGVSFSFGAAEQ